MYHLKSWSPSSGTEVSSRQVGAIAPRPSDLNVVAYLEGGTPVSIQQWDPSIAEDHGEPNAPLPEPAEVYPTILQPGFHGCASLHGVKMGTRVALVRGQNCAGQMGHALFAVPVQFGTFAGPDLGIYPPFFISEIGQDSHYSVFEDVIAFESNNDIVVMRLDVDLMGPRPPQMPYDNNGQDPVRISPWNVGLNLWSIIDYGNGGRYQQWQLHGLSANRTYRFTIRGESDCNDWQYDTRAIFWGSGVSLEVDDNETSDPTFPHDCAAFDFTPTDDLQVFSLRIERKELGPIGLEPPMMYILSVDPL